MRPLTLSLLSVAAAVFTVVASAGWLFPRSLVLIPSVQSIPPSTNHALHAEQEIQAARGGAQKKAADVVRVISASELVAQKQAAVIQDSFGNYRADLSTAGFQSREYLLSSQPIYYPDTAMLAVAEQQGCALSGYYIESQARASLAVLDGSSATIYHYQCIFDAATGGYRLQKNRENTALGASLGLLFHGDSKTVPLRSTSSVSGVSHD